jgi:hypothetical protein
VNNELEGMWKEAVVICFKVLSIDLIGWTEKMALDLSTGADLAEY